MKNNSKIQNGYTNVLVHWGEKEDHKYIARVPLKKKGKNGQKYMYFYTKEAYQAYLNGQKTLQSANKFLKNTGNELKKTAKDIKKTIDPKKDKEAAKLTNLSSVNSKSIDNGKKFTDKNLTKEVGTLGLFIPMNVAIDAVNFVYYSITGLFNKNNDDQKEQSEKKQEEKQEEKPKRKELTKEEKLQNPDERADYNKRLEHQQNEPDFMKNIPEIPLDTVFTKFEDQSEVNEVYDPWDEASAANCSNCSAAYELRRRGYDVEAKLRDDDYNGRGDRIYDYFEDAQLIAVNSDGSTFVHNEEFVRKLWDGTITVDDLLDEKNDKDYDYYYNDQDQDYTASSIEKAIKDNNPPGSRGFIDVDWKGGGGHSIVYEVDTKGKVTIRDSQTWDEYSTDELASKVSKVRIARTDNLKLKEDILDAVTTNRKRKRKYYMNDEHIYDYDPEWGYL